MIKVRLSTKRFLLEFVSHSSIYYLTAFLLSTLSVALGLWVTLERIEGISGRERYMELLVGVVASLIAMAIGWMLGYFFRGVRYEKALFNAAERYGAHIEGLITAATNEGADRVRANAQAIVSTRDDLRGSLVSLQELLNSDIDRLAQQLRSQMPAAVLIETCDVLAKKWPAKRDQIEVTIRKIFAELGLEKSK